jgi:hypothetical protein
MGGDIPRAHAAGVEVQHPIIQPRQPRLALGHELRIKRAVAIPRGADRDLAELGLDRLGRVPVAMIARPARRRPTGRIPQVLGQLRPQRGVQDTAGELAHQPSRAGDLFRPEPGQRVLQGVVGQQTRETAANLLKGTLGTRRTSVVIR